MGTFPLQEMFATHDEVRNVVRGSGGNYKLRFEIGVMGDMETVAIRASQCHSASSGVADNILPVVGNLVSIVHGTTLNAAKSIVHEGISKADRLHIHFYESDLEGRVIQTTPRISRRSEVTVVVSDGRCAKMGMVFTRRRMGPF